MADVNKNGAKNEVKKKVEEMTGDARAEKAKVTGNTKEQSLTAAVAAGG